MSRHVQSTTENGLTRKQETLITALLSLPTIQAAARVAGVADKTARRWLKLPHIQQAYQDAQRNVFDASITTLKLAMHDAVSTLQDALKDTEISAATRVRAAQIIIEQSLELHKMAELEAKIAELEAIVLERQV